VERVLVNDASGPFVTFWPLLELRPGERLSPERVAASILGVREGQRLTLVGEAADGTQERLEVAHLAGDAFRCRQVTQPSDPRSPFREETVELTQDRLLQVLEKFPEPWWV
jgi:hypothetical protein